MKYSIENNGQGLVMIRVYVPESLAASFLAFIDQKSRENHYLIKSPSPVRNENYFKELNDNAAALFSKCSTAGMSNNSSISEINKKLKGLGFRNISYDIVKSILTKQGCFKMKKALNIA